MRAAVGVALLLAACGAPATLPRDAGSGANGDGGATGVGGAGSGGITDGGGGASSDGGGLVLPAQCPCPLGSYCDLASNSCKLGCLGDDQCPAGERCDTSVFLCLRVCDDTTMPCPNHVACNRVVAHGVKVCALCDAPSAIGSTCCASGWGNCNGNTTDGCETKLDSLVNCGRCGNPAALECYPDHDGDRWGVPTNVQVVCQYCPPGTMAKGDLNGLDDCDDNDSKVHPMQTDFFTSPRPSGSWDYDCSGAVEVQLDYPNACPYDCGGLDAYFWAKKTPGCGESASTDYCYIDHNTGMCLTASVPAQTQACH